MNAAKIAMRKIAWKRVKALQQIMYEVFVRLQIQDRQLRLLDRSC